MLGHSEILRSCVELRAGKQMLKVLPKDMNVIKGEYFINDPVEM